MSSFWDDLSYLLRQIRWNDLEVVEHFQNTITDTVPEDQRAMLVPQCKTCKHWVKDDPSNPDTGLCDSQTFDGHEPSTMWTDCGENTIRTDSRFGCVNWEHR